MSGGLSLVRPLVCDGEKNVSLGTGSVELMFSLPDSKSFRESRGMR